MTPMITTQSTPFSSPVLLRLCPEQGHRHHPGLETFLIFLFLSLLNNINPLVTYFNSRCCQTLPENPTGSGRSRSPLGVEDAEVVVDVLAVVVAVVVSV